MKTTLTIEESARLIELGVDETLTSHKESNFYNGISSEEYKVYHLFALTDILSILPKEILADEQKSDNHIYVCPLSIKWYIKYKMWEVRYEYTEYFSAPELIDALNQLLIWAITNGHVKTDKK